ncbi:hypothetical protein B0H14DRAFT_3458336 [Mycena olivaceomarginata]|nr:hypothetical protein B0H14DRAFT_3458336 [Mycena olivaceomarginata]
MRPSYDLGDAHVQMNPASLQSLTRHVCLLYNPAAPPMPAITARSTGALIILDCMARRYSPLASPHHVAFGAQVPPTFSQWVMSPIAVINDGLRPTHLPYAIHRQRACKTQHIRCVVLTLFRSFFPLLSPAHGYFYSSL